MKKSLQFDNFVVSCGGGIILSQENRNILFENSEVITIYLKTSPETIFERIKDDKTRPLLLVENPKKEIEKILNQREKYYNKANITIETDNKTQEEILDKILEEIWKK